MFLHDEQYEKAIHFSRFDKGSVFSTVADFPFELDEMNWLTAEHYYQACKYKGLPHAQKIITAEDGRQAYELGNRRLKRKIKDWKANRKLYMTRALYRRVKEFSEVRQALLDTTDQLLIETSQYDYYWGLGRDQRGENTLGKIWMDIRSKLLSE